MEEIAFGDWPGQPVDLSGSNPWLPAYGFQPPRTLLDKDDFIGNPDADLFFNGAAIQPYVYLETIQEETSDDLRSDSERSEESREEDGSPVGWLATDSESGSVIRINAIGDPETERDAKLLNNSRLTQQQQQQPPTSDNTNYLCLSDDESNYSISRSSSLLQFETLEKQCQDLSTSSPSILSSFTFDSIENRNNPDNDYYKTLKIEKAANMKSHFRDDDHAKRHETVVVEKYNGLKQSKSFDDLLKDEADDDEATVNFFSLGDFFEDDSVKRRRRHRYHQQHRGKRSTIKRASTLLHGWSSFDNLQSATAMGGNRAKERTSAENLSEDSGYSDNVTTTTTATTTTTSNKLIHKRDRTTTVERQSRQTMAAATDFDAYDCDVDHSFGNTNLGVSYHDLRLFGNNGSNCNHNGNGTNCSNNSGNGNARAKSSLFKPFASSIDEFVGDRSKNNSMEFTSIISEEASAQSTSVPDLLLLLTVSRRSCRRRYLKHNNPNNRKFGNNVRNDSLSCRSGSKSLPKDLNLFGDSGKKNANNDRWHHESDDEFVTIAAKNLDLCDALLSKSAGKMSETRRRLRPNGGDEGPDKIFIPLKGGGESSPEPDATPSFKREGSYQEAMENSLYSSDEERGKEPPQRKPKKKLTLIDFDRQILKAISEQSIASLTQSGDLMQMFVTSTPNAAGSPKKRNSLIVKSTPNIPFLNDDDDDVVVVRTVKPKETSTKPRRYIKRQRHGHANFDSTVISTPNLSSCNYTKDEDSLVVNDRTNASEDNNVGACKLNYSKSFNDSYNTKADTPSKDLHETRSISGSIGSKGVHFCPIVAEVNWKDEHDDRQTSISSNGSSSSSNNSNAIEQRSPDKDGDERDSPPPLPVRERRAFKRSLASSSSEREINDDDLPFFLKRNVDNPIVVRPEPRKPSLHVLSASQPDLNAEKKLEQRQQHENALRNEPKSAEDLSEVQLRRKSSVNAGQSNSSLKRRGSQIIKRSTDGTLSQVYVDGDGVSYVHSCLGKPAVPTTAAGTTPTTTSTTAAKNGSSSNNNDNNKSESRRSSINKSKAAATATVTSKTSNATTSVKKTSSAMDALSGGGGTTSKRTNKFGGFFSRLANFRFSTRKKPEAAKAEATKPATIVVETDRDEPAKVDYIYIPLRDPKEGDHPDADDPEDDDEYDGDGEDGRRNRRRVSAPSSNNNNNGRIVTCGKPPPVPKLPPKVVGASVKRRHARHADEPDFVARNCIDSGRTTCPPPMEQMGLIETDLDTEVTVITSGAHAKTRSLMNLGADAAPKKCHLVDPTPDVQARPHKSMEFLLDKQNLRVVEPPENELQKCERVMSEHELRVQRSLQKLNVPDWYKQAQVPKEGFILRKSGNNNVNASTTATPSSVRETRWHGVAATSLSSLGSTNHQSPLILSPTPQNNQSFVRWSTSKLNSTASSPCASTRSSFNARQQQPTNGSMSPSSLRSSFTYRQPYMGWRSQERLTRPRTPAERLANTLIATGPTSTASSLSASDATTPFGNDHGRQGETREIQTSIKEVTSAIVHYVSGLRPDRDECCGASTTASDDNVSQRSRSLSPRGSQKLYWLESSFVGTRPLDSPQTPVALGDDGGDDAPAAASAPALVPPSSLKLDLQQQQHQQQAIATHNDLNIMRMNNTKPSPESTTLEDVLDSLLGLPSSTRAPSPSLQGTASANTSPARSTCDNNDPRPTLEPFRRRSEGSEPVARRVSFHASPPPPSLLLRCRYSRCARVASAASGDGAAFKNCHNCTYTYCSRACRRAHWEKHRRTCLFSRVGSLCRQAIAAAKEQRDTLLHLSVIARRGYLSHGHGAVKCFFPCAEAAERFLRDGFDALGEITYVQWPDLLPSEMGAQMYAELVKMCKSYNPDTRMVIYVSVCVVSEAPAAGAVKWERQLVSRCAKMRLSRDVPIPEREQTDPETLVLTCRCDDSTSTLETRRIGFENIQRHLRRRGVSLRRQYADVYRLLGEYVNGTRDRFEPVTVYPRDADTGKTFMCIIMPDADPESLKQVIDVGVRVRSVDVLNEALRD